MKPTNSAHVRLTTVTDPPDMSPRTRIPAAFAVRRSDVQGSAPSCLFLRSTEDGWSLLGSRGEVVFRTLGAGGRRQCLEFARQRGVRSVLA